MAAWVAAVWMVEAAALAVERVEGKVVAARAAARAAGRVEAVRAAERVAVATVAATAEEMVAVEGVEEPHKQPWCRHHKRRSTLLMAKSTL